MVQFNLQQRELTLKVVYYGPALSGKTTNLQAIHQMVPAGGAGRLMTLETRDDRTLFFDLLPVFFRTRSGYRVKLKLFTVPGQVIHDSTRKVVLNGADGVVFIADSQIAESQANKLSFRNLRENLAANGLDLDQLPLVIQFNKRDLPDIRSEAELQALEERRKTPVYRAVAITGQGVRETLEGLVALIWDSLETSYDIGRKLQVERNEFLEQVFRDWNPLRVQGGFAP
jgi:signal recognition particle receptor subunit beta